MKPGFILANLLLLTLFFSCSSKESEEKSGTDTELVAEKFFVVPGEDEAIDPEQIQKGEVLISYSDCYSCHKEESRAKGPSFTDIAKRYPIRQVYIDLLARKVIDGGSGVWGYPVMGPHPKLKFEETQAMVAFILSLEKK